MPLHFAARLAGRLVKAILPRGQRDWAEAIVSEIEAIPAGGEALRFSLSAVRGAAVIAGRHIVRSPRGCAILCGTMAALIGIGFLWVAGAPAQYVVMNGAALALALVTVALLGRWTRATAMRSDLIVVAGSIALLATAVFGASVEGAARWVAIGGVAVQPSLIVLPAMIVAYGRRPTALGSLAMIVAAVAMALQPDRAMAAVLVAGIGALLVTQPRTARGPAIVAVCAWIVTMIRPDTLPARPFVDGILYSSFVLHPLVGLALLGGVMLLPLPALLQRGRTPEMTAFGAIWVAVVFAAALGNYPTPLVGYGGSAILGYLLSAWCLPRHPARDLHDHRSGSAVETSATHRPFLMGSPT